MKHDKDRFEARCILAEEYLLKLKRMKPLNERKQYVDYMSGKQIPAREFNNGACDIFSDYVWTDVVKEHCARQASLPIEGFDGDVFYTKSRPILLTPEKEHLLETPEQRRIKQIQAELKTYES